MTPISPITGSGPLADSMVTAASAMHAQSVRIRVVSENLANADSTAAIQGGSPYQRKVVTFQQAVDRTTGASLVEVSQVSGDTAPFKMVYQPSNPGANAQGYVEMPNVSPVVEMADMREAERSYEANLAVIGEARSMISKTLDILKA